MQLLRLVVCIAVFVVIPEQCVATPSPIVLSEFTSGLKLITVCWSFYEHAIAYFQFQMNGYTHFACFYACVLFD